MRAWKVGGVAAALVAAGIAGSALPGSAQKNSSKEKPIIGFVDLGAVTEKIKDTAEWKTNVKRFQDEQAKHRNEIEELTNLRFLTPAEIQELQNLKAKTSATDGEKARIKALMERSNQLDAEYQKLAQTEKPSAEQTKRLGELNSMRENASVKVQTELEKRTGVLQGMENEMLKAMQDKILKHVAQIAEKEGLSVVVDRQAVLYGGQDLTQDVAKKLGP